MNNKVSYIPLIIAVLVLGIALTVAFMFTRSYTFHGTVISPPLPVTDFTLQTANNETFRLSEARGKIVLLFFGYTSCPDVCPTTLATFKQVFDRLGDDAQKVAVVMVTADPDRDTPDKVASYAAHFNPDFIGLSGSIADLEPIWEQLGVFVEKEDTGSAAGYLVSHTASVYVLDQNGSLTMTLPYGTAASDITADLNELLKQSQEK